MGSLPSESVFAGASSRQRRGGSSDARVGEQLWRVPGGPGAGEVPRGTARASRFRQESSCRVGAWLFN